MKKFKEAIAKTVFAVSVFTMLASTNHFCKTLMAYENDNEYAESSSDDADENNPLYINDEHSKET